MEDLLPSLEFLFHFDEIFSEANDVPLHVFVSCSENYMEILYSNSFLEIVICVM